MSAAGAELVLLIGDFHIPSRAHSLPPCLKELLDTDRISTVLCTGNVGSDTTLKMVKGIAKNVHIVKGDFDQGFDFPESAVVKIGQVVIGLTHGHQIIPLGDIKALSNVQKKMNCDILVTGHTHRSSIEEYLGHYYVNPGSATGVDSADHDLTTLAEARKGGPLPDSTHNNCVPSFMLMAVNGFKIALYLYEARDGKSDVVMSEIVVPQNRHERMHRSLLPRSSGKGNSNESSSGGIGSTAESTPEGEESLSKKG